MSDGSTGEGKLAELVSTFTAAYARTRAEDARARQALDEAVAAIEQNIGLTFARGKPRREWVDSGRLDDGGKAVFDADGSLRTRLTYELTVDPGTLAESDPGLSAILQDQAGASTAPLPTSFQLHLDLIMRRDESKEWVMRIGERGEDIAFNVVDFAEEATQAAMKVMKKQLAEAAVVPVRPSKQAT
jgi:hypothetical protein